MESGLRRLSLERQSCGHWRRMDPREFYSFNSASRRASVGGMESSKAIQRLIHKKLSLRTQSFQIWMERPGLLLRK